jgi:hypothetical protein
MKLTLSEKKALYLHTGGLRNQLGFNRNSIQSGLSEEENNYLYGSWKSKVTSLDASSLSDELQALIKSSIDDLVFHSSDQPPESDEAYFLPLDTFFSDDSFNDINEQDVTWGNWNADEFGMPDPFSLIPGSSNLEGSSTSWRVVRQNGYWTSSDPKDSLPGMPKVWKVDSKKFKKYLVNRDYGIRFGSLVETGTRKLTPSQAHAYLSQKGKPRVRLNKREKEALLKATT